MFGVELVTNNFLGAPIAGLLIGMSLYTPFIADTVLLIISTFFIFKISGNFERPVDNKKSEKTLDLIKEGISWLKKQVLLKRLAIYTGLANFFGAMQFPIMVLFAQEILELNSVQYAFLAYGAAIGGLLGSTLANKINEVFKESKTLILAMFLFFIRNVFTLLNKKSIYSGASFCDHKLWINSLECTSGINQTINNS